jgi:tRNA(Ile)-lysidine synthase
VFGPTFSKTHIDAVCELVLNWHGQKELTLPGVRVVRQDGDLVFKSSKTLKPGAC